VNTEQVVWSETSVAVPSRTPRALTRALIESVRSSTCRVLSVATVNISARTWRGPETDVIWATGSERTVTTELRIMLIVLIVFPMEPSDYFRMV